jgi:hypothetical protein
MRCRGKVASSVDCGSSHQALLGDAGGVTIVARGRGSQPRVGRTQPTAGVPGKYRRRVNDAMFKIMNGVHRMLRTVTGGRFGNSFMDMPVLELTTTGRRAGSRAR